MRSCVYEGKVRHRRVGPVPHAFSNRVRLLYVDLAELPELFSGRWLWSARRPAPGWFRRADYLGDPTVPLDAAVRDLVQERTGRRPEGPIALLTRPRTWFFVFNPVSFYYCYDRSGTRVETIVAEIENTPWGERHAYVLPPELDEARGRSKRRYRFAKAFHVSPFLDVGLAYDWRFTEPGRSLVVHMDVMSRDVADGTPSGTKLFDATLTLERREASGLALARLLGLTPFAGVRVLAAIYWNALRLWWKRVPVFTHPRYRKDVEKVES